MKTNTIIRIRTYFFFFAFVRKKSIKNTKISIEKPKFQLKFQRLRSVKVQKNARN